MKKNDVGIISSCKSFRIALNTILSCESDDYVSNIWTEKDLDNVLNKETISPIKPNVLILDIDHSPVPVSSLLEIVRKTFKRAKVIVMLGTSKVDLNLINRYRVSKVLKRTCSENELLSAVRLCVDHSA